MRLSCFSENSPFEGGGAVRRVKEGNGMAKTQFIVLVWFGLFIQLPSLAQVCTNDGCNLLQIDDLRETFSFWPQVSPDCNGDNDSDVLDFVCLINQVPGLGKPVFDTVGMQTVEAGSLLEFVVDAMDPNGDPLDFQADNAPENASFDMQSRLFSFSPAMHQVGVHTVRFIASDGFLTGILDVEIVVTSSVDCNSVEPTVLDFSPAHGEREVAVTRETIIRFSRPLGVQSTIDESVIFSKFAGVVLPAAYRLSSDRRKVTLFYDAPLPSSARIRLTIVGDSLQDELGCPVDADGDGAPGGTAIVDFDTLTLASVSNTAVCGRVFSSDLVMARGSSSLVNQPLEGVTITVDGMEDTLFTVTDAMGNFRLETAPAGRFFVHVDGRTVSQNLPPGAYFPFVGKTWTSVAGQEVNIGEVYLPLVVDGTLQAVSDTQDTTIGFPPEVVNSDPRFSDVSITVPAGSLFDDQGNSGGMVGMAPVDPDRLPGALPEDLDFPLVITVQTDGPTNFDIPAPVCFPNLPDPDTGLALAPGEKSALWSFNHDTGRWEIAGSMTVSQDGSLVCSDPGSGVRAPGWHGTRPGTQGGGAPPDGPEAPEQEPGTDDGDCPKNKTDPIHLFSGEFYITFEDLRIRGRGFDFVWERKYRSKIGPNTAQGNGWDFNYNAFIEKSGVLRVLCNGASRRDFYYPRPDMPNTWARNEFFNELKQEADGSYTLTQADRTKWTFFPLDGSPAQGKISSMIGRNGNTMTFGYDDQGRLSLITDTLSRDIQVAYDSNGMIQSLTDFAGRTIAYDYYQLSEPGGNVGDLKAVTTQAIIGTPNGNDFPDGKTTVYTYSKGFTDDRLNHNLLTITDPKGQTYLENTYATVTDPSGTDYDRVLRQRWGHPDEIIDLVYVPLTPSAQNGEAMIKTIVNDRVGNVSEYFYNLSNRVVRFREYTGRAIRDQATTETQNRPINKLRNSDPDFFETRYEWNADALLSRQIHPNGNITEFIYESDLDPTARPRQRGNLRKVRRLPGTHVPVGAQTVLEESFEYDDDFGCGACGTNFVTKRVDARGNETVHDYDANGNRTRTTHRIASIVETWEYNEFGQLEAQTLPDNGSGHQRRDEFNYYDSGPQTGYLQQVMVDAGNLNLTTSIAYDLVGNIVSKTDPRGNDTQYTVNAMDQVVREISRETQPGSGVRYQTDFFYDANDNLIQTDVLNLDEAGVQASNAIITTTFEYEILNRLVRRSSEIEEGQTLIEEYEYDGNRNRTLERYGEAVNSNQPGNTKTSVFDERDLLFKEIRAQGTSEQSTTQLDYDANQNLIFRRIGLEQNPRVWETVFDAYNRKVSTFDPMGNETKMGYDANGNLVAQSIWGEVKDIVGSANNIRLSDATGTYDAMDRQLTWAQGFFETATGLAIDDGFSITTKTYTKSSQLSSVTDDNGHVMSYAYDSANRRSLITDAAGNTVAMSYDANDNLVSQTETDRSDSGAPDQVFTTTFAFDQLDRMIRITDNVGNQTDFAYDSRDNRTLTVDALGNRTRNQFDGLNRMVFSTKELTDTGTGMGSTVGAITIGQEWDDSSRLVAQIDGLGNRTTYVYDALDRRKETVFADQTRYLEVYDVHGNPISQTDANGSLSTNTFDLLDRLVLRDVVAGPGVNGDTTFEQFSFDGLSRLTVARDNDSNVTRTYDSLSNMTQETLNGKVTSATFDGEGNMLSCTYPGGRTIDYGFDTLDRLQVIEEAGSLLATYSYIGPERVEALDFGNQTRMTLTYDGITGVPNPAGDFGVKRIIRSTHTHLPSTTVIDDRAYTWDARFNKTSRNDQKRGTGQAFSYDSAYRMQEYSETPVKGGPQVTTYGLDEANNRTQVMGGPNPGTYTLSSVTPEPADAQMNQYTTTSYDQRQYDLNGNLKYSDQDQASERFFLYDYRNQLVSFQDSAANITANYAYDALGRRISKTILTNTSETTRYFYSNLRVIEEQDNAGTTLATYVYGNYIDEVLTMHRDGSDFFFHRDDLFNVTSLTDSSGALVESYEYGAFGFPEIFDGVDNPLAQSATGNPFFFTGRRWDPESNLYYYRTRYMDPIAGRFISRDSIGIWGDSGNLGNGFSYVGSASYSAVDPIGQFYFSVARFIMMQVIKSYIEAERFSRTDAHKLRNRHNHCPSEIPLNENRLAPEPMNACGANEDDDFKDYAGNPWKYEGRPHEKLHGGMRTFRGMGKYNGSQCTYDENGGLVNSGPHQGTHDYFPPYDKNGNFDPTKFLQHIQYDVLPHFFNNGYENSTNIIPRNSNSFHRSSSTP